MVTWDDVGAPLGKILLVQILCACSFRRIIRINADTMSVVAEVEFGWLIRSIHAWSANLMIATLLIHLVSAYFTQAYRMPRELTWLSGALLLGLTLGFGFSGYLPPWNTLAYFASIERPGQPLRTMPFVPNFLLRDVVGWLAALAAYVP